MNLLLKSGQSGVGLVSFLTLCCIFGTKDKADIVTFLKKFRQDLPGFERIVSKKQIPENVFREINGWKKKHIYSVSSDEDSEVDNRRSHFDMADVNKPYNWNCTPKKRLSFRQLVFAGKSGSKYFIVYNHGQGRSHNKKLLYLDLKNSDKLTVLYLDMAVTSPELLQEHLDALSTLSETDLKHHIYLFEGMPYPDWLDFERISF